MIRSKDAWKDVKIVLLSGDMNPKLIAQLSSYGVAAILPKMTTTPKKLAEKVSEIQEKG
jgi:DNA-binding NarL/FixJ family response regulator